MDDSTALLLLAVGRLAMAETANFDDAPIGSAPEGWTITMTGKGDPRWTIEKDDTAPSQANVLKQSGNATYPLALKDGTSIKNGFIAVKFKAISGSEDRAAGLVWRAVDANNYYVVRANALEDNVVLYKTVNGVRTRSTLSAVKAGTASTCRYRRAGGTLYGSNLPGRDLARFTIVRCSSRSRMQHSWRLAISAYGPRPTA